MWWKRPRVWFFVLLIIAVSAAAALSWFLTEEGRQHADQWSSIIFGGTAAAAVLVTALRWLWLQDTGPTGTVTPERLAAAQAVLARAQIEQWTAEEVARQIQDPWPLRVRWQVSRRARLVMASWAAVRGAPDAGELPLEGTYDRIADVFDHPDSPRRLVVLGEPGAGKSMLVLHLTLQLLHRRGEHDPVPVLLPVAGWDPAQPLDEWIAARLATDHRLLSTAVEAPGGTRRTLARELVARGMILPILDGLDEIGPSHHSRALTAISAAAGSGARFVLTSRTRAYERAVHDSTPLARTPVVELQPMTPDDAARYLTDGTDQPIPRWNPVLARLAAGDDSPLAQTLSTPLMIWLARVVYQHRDSDPGELVTAGWATSRAGIEKHLLQQLVPAAYTAAVGGRPGRTVAEADRARRRLTTLARHLGREQTYDLAWWQLNEVPPGPAVEAMTVLATGVAILAGLTLCIFGIVGMVDLQALYPHLGWLWGGLNAGLAVALTTGLIRRVFESPRAPRRIQVTLGRAAWLFIACPIGLVAVLAGEPVAGILGTLTAGLCTPLVSGSIHAGGNDQRGLSPAALLADDRNSAFVALATSLLLAATVWSTLGASSGEPVLDALFFGVLWLFLPVAVVISSAWGQFCVVRAVLFLCGRAPLRLMGFLGEAHDRGVLRQAGGVHQFRHNLLQDHLAARSATGSADRATP
ncbi:NACHT domain-containing protein [Actinoplanes sp. CA-051413]|uniref:NACHT domain-containing protein n=1 Tax=Actinoplanes sp. CA-051413 TaxID=3239899 RepID=UPI003D97F270